MKKYEKRRRKFLGNHPQARRRKMEYKILTGTSEDLSGKVTDHSNKGWTIWESPFRTGNKILIGGDPAYSNSCDYTAEIAQAVIFDKR